MSESVRRDGRQGAGGKGRKNRFVLLAGLFFLLMSFVACPSYADVVYYKSGENLKGLVIEEHHDRIVVSTEAGEWTILRKDIQEVFYDDPERNYLFMGNQAIEEKNFTTAQMFYRRALQIQPGFFNAEDSLNRLADLKRKAQAAEDYPDPVGVLQNRWGLTVQIKVDRPEVQAVKPNSLAARSGIAVGDSLVTAWGYSLSFMTVEELAKTLLGPAGSPVRVTIGRKVLLSKSDKKAKWPGMELTMEPLGLTVKEEDPKGASVKAGLLMQDRIVEINGFPTRYMPLAEARKLFKEAKGDVPLVIRRDIMVKRE